jgi:hypothetical protein
MAGVVAGRSIVFLSFCEGWLCPTCQFRPGEKGVVLRDA